MTSIDPATLKIIMQVALQAMTDEKTQKRITYIIAIPVVALLLIISLIQYIFTTPSDVLAADFDMDYAMVEEFMTEYGSEFEEYDFWKHNEHMLNTDYETGDFSQYDAFDAELFSQLMGEATKYIGMPYVWGGSSPSTSFDCSGYICWIYTQSGVYTLPRTTAQGIYNQCATLPRSQAKAGDLVFFTKTYQTSNPVTHIGLYLGDGKMLHCGSPIGYADIDSPYWSSHFYAFGRLPIKVAIPESE